MSVGWASWVILLGDDPTVLQAGEPLTALRFDESGMHCAVGTGSGLVALFDLRSSRPLLVKDHMYSSPIVDIKFQDPHGGAGIQRESHGVGCRICTDRRLH